MKLVHVVWRDHSFAGGELAAPMIFQTAGFLVRDEPDHIVLVWSIGYGGEMPDEQNIETLCLLRECIVEMSVLR